MSEPNVDNPFAGLSPLSANWSEPEPFLAIYVLDHILTTTPTEFNKTGKQWEHGLRGYKRVHSGATGFKHEFCSPADGPQSKLAIYLDHMKQHLRPEDLTKIHAAGGIGNNGLVGAVCWVVPTNSKKFWPKMDTQWLTLPFRRATDEEVVEVTLWAQQNPIQVMSEPGSAPSMVSIAASMDWSEDRVSKAMSLLVGKTKVQVFGGLDDLGDDQELRAAVVSGAASNWLVENEFATLDSEGVIQPIAAEAGKRK